jgi:D-alanyl-D-alanine carboxypeptidase/D-alanyl-D-alanine-endopeptidase (penicillin-binding protein 4)
MKGEHVRRTRRAAVVTLAMLNVTTLAAAIAVARMLPPRLAALRVPVAASRPVVTPVPVLPPLAESPAPQANNSRGSNNSGNENSQPGSNTIPTASGLAAVIQSSLATGAAGSRIGVAVTDAATGKLLYADNGNALATPASTTKVATAAAALAALGPDARFTTSVRQVNGGIVLVGGGDPTLAVNAYPPADYPRPATLATLAASTANALKASGQTHVRLGYDTSLYSGPGLAPGWTSGLVSTGNVTPIVSLEADQGRLTAGGALQDDDDPVNYSRRTMNPAGMTASAFAKLLRQDGVKITGDPAPVTAPKGAVTLASVSSPPLYAIAEQMLQESNNVIAENLGRQTALALGLPATFAGAARAVQTEIRRLGVTTPISLVDTSGLSPDDGIAPETLVKIIEIAAGVGGAPASGAARRARDAVTGLPIAGFSGTLSPGESVFGQIGGAARGVVRAKTGNLTTVAALAGLVTDRDGRLLAFALMAPRIPNGNQLQAAANAIDATAEGLAACGCR